MSVNAAARKIQEVFRRKLIFTNNQGTYKASKPVITAQIVSFKLPTLWTRVFESEPKGFSEIIGYRSTDKAPVIRWDSKEHRWIGDATGVTKLVAKYRAVTIVVSDKGFDVLGSGNYEQALLAIVKSGWAPKLLLKAPPTYKKIDGMFNVNKRFDLKELASELRKLPESMRERVQAASEFGIKAVLLKLKKPKWTYQFFENGTVLFSGINNPKDLNLPRELFFQFLTPTYGVAPALAFQPGRGMLMKPRKNAGAAARARAANRYPLAASWTATPPPGYYVRPGQNNKPRLYMWAKMERRPELPHPIQVGQLKLTAKNAATVARRFREVGVEPPPATKQVFRNLGIPLPTENLEKRSPNRAERSEWNFVDPSGKKYVRPGPGHQPRVYDVPKDKKAGAKTVIKAYAAAKRNIPPAVRALFGIGANVKTANTAGPKHRVEMGLNKILRINGKQATRISAPELLAIARNLGIAQVNAKTSKTNLIGYIQTRTGTSNRPNRSADVLVDGIYYKFLNNGKVRRVTEEGVATEREWVTLGSNVRQKIAQKLLTPNLLKQYNALNMADRFNAIRAVLHGKKEAAAKAAANKAAAEKAVANKAAANAKAAAEEKARNNAEAEALARELEWNMRLFQNLGPAYNKNNAQKLIRALNGLPKGARGEPLKKNVEALYKRFVKNAYLLRGQQMPKKPRKERASPNRRLNYVYTIPGNAVNLSNTLESLGVNTRKNWTWNEIRVALKGKVKAAQMKKLQEQWKKNVMNKVKFGAVGPLKRKVQKPTAKQS
jgi:hypothetical protein